MTATNSATIDAVAEASATQIGASTVVSSPLGEYRAAGTAKPAGDTECVLGGDGVEIGIVRDIVHRFVMAGLWELSAGHGRACFQHGVREKVLGGWNLPLRSLTVTAGNGTTTNSPGYGADVVALRRCRRPLRNPEI